MKAALALFVMLFLSLDTERALAQDQAAWARLRATPEGAKLTVTLVHGGVVTGRLAEVGEASFQLWVRIDPEGRLRLGERKRRIGFEDVRTIEGLKKSPPDLSLRAGRDVKVTADSGDVVRGTVQLFDGDRLQVNGRTWRLSDGEVITVETRVSDSPMDGALVGAGVGAGLSLLVLFSCGTSCPNSAAPFLPVIGIGAGLGVLFDALKKETKLLYPGEVGSDARVSISPLLSRDHRGVLVTFRF